MAILWFVIGVVAGGVIFACGRRLARQQRWRYWPVTTAGRMLIGFSFIVWSFAALIALSLLPG